VPNIRWLLALVTVIHRFLFRLTNGRIGGRLAGNEMLLLATIGRKTGRAREVPLLTVPDDDAWIVVASNAGDDRPPAWWLNLQARPEAEIRVAGQRRAVRARLAGPDERPRLWAKVIASHSGYAAYETRTTRPIPVVLLEPR
jgi:deazaflavin-dependent oxidoreductase (nitroreductase family)